MPISDVVRRAAQAVFPIEVFDNFNRTNRPLDGDTTSDGKAEWEVLRGGAWSVSNNRAVGPSITSNSPVAVVETHASDIDVRVDISATGRDALIFRANDADNWFRIRNFYSSSGGNTNSPTTKYCTQYEYRASWGAQLAATNVNAQNNCCNDCTHFAPVTFSWCANASCCIGTTLNHSHVIYNCGSSQNWNHNHARSACNQTSTRQVSCGSNPGNVNAVTHTYRYYYEKMVNGTLVSASSFSNIGSTNRIRVQAVENSISVFRATNVLVRSFDDPFNSDATKHGIARGESSGGNSTSIDNFHAIPI